MVDFEKEEQDINAMIQSLADGKQADVETIPAPEEPAQELDTPVEPEPTGAEESLELPDVPFDPYASEGDDEPKPAKEEDYEHKYKVLQGMYRKQVVEVQENNRQLETRNAELSALVSQLRDEIAALQARPGGESGGGGVDDDVDLNAYDEFGPEIRSMAERNLRLSRELQEVRGQLNELGQATSLAAEERFTQYMDTRVPNWKKQDADPNFIQWLQLLSTDTGRPKHDSLRNAYQARDAARVAAIFNEYRNFLALQRSRLVSEEPSSDPSEQKRKRPSPAPASRPGSAPQAQKAKYTLTDWTNLHDRAQRGEFNNNPAEYKRLEAEIHAAVFSKDNR